MKKNLLFAAFLPLVNVTFSQQTPPQKIELKQLQPSKEVTGGTTISAAPAEPDSVIIARLDYQIAAIRRKMEYVRSDQSMFERATKDGWFEQMEKHIASAEAKKKKITQ